jgi:hypothetical protein
MYCWTIRAIFNIITKENELEGGNGTQIHILAGK